MQPFFWKKMTQHWFLKYLFRFPAIVEGSEMMSLIEHFHGDDWSDFFRDCFENVLSVLKNDRHAFLGSAGDDLRSWFAAGGLPLVKERLNRVMAVLDFPERKRLQINRFLAHLVYQNRSELLHLMRQEIIPLI